VITNYYDFVKCKAYDLQWFAQFSTTKPNMNNPDPTQPHAKKPYGFARQSQKVKEVNGKSLSRRVDCSRKVFNSSNIDVPFGSTPVEHF